MREIVFGLSFYAVGDIIYLSGKLNIEQEP